MQEFWKNDEIVSFGHNDPIVKMPQTPVVQQEDEDMAFAENANFLSARVGHVQSADVDAFNEVYTGKEGVTQKWANSLYSNLSTVNGKADDAFLRFRETMMSAEREERELDPTQAVSTITGKQMGQQRTPVAGGLSRYSDYEGRFNRASNMAAYAATEIIGSAIASIGEMGGNGLIQSLGKNISGFADEYKASAKASYPTETKAEQEAIAIADVAGHIAGEAYIGAPKAMLFVASGLTQLFGGKEASKEMHRVVGEFDEAAMENLRRIGREDGVLAAVVSSTGGAIASIYSDLQVMKGLGFKFPGQTAAAHSNAASMAIRLRQAAELGVYKALTTYGGSEERKNAALMTFAYMSTPAFSGWLDKSWKVIGADFLANTAISSKQYYDIVSSDMDMVEKSIEISRIVGVDAFFSSITKSFRESPQYRAAEAELAYFNAVDAAVREQLRPENAQLRAMENPLVLSRAQAAALKASMEGKGYYDADLEKAKVQADLEATREALRADVEKMESESKVEPKPEQTEKTQEPTVKDSLSVGKPAAKTAPPLESREVELAAKKAMLDVLDATEGQSPAVRELAYQARLEQLGEVLDAPKGTAVKTLVNRINNIRQKKPVVSMTSKEYYSKLQEVSKTAAKESVKDVAEKMRIYEDFARDSLPYRDADKVVEKLRLAAEKGPTPARFDAMAQKILESAYGVKKRVEATTGLKDLTKQVDYTEAELLRAVMKEMEKTSKSARRSTVDKIIASNRIASEILDGMPTETKGKMIAKLKAIANAKTDVAQAKALAEFGEYADIVVERFRYNEEKAGLDKARKSAKQLLKSGQVRADIRADLEGIIDSMDSGDIVAKFTALANKSNLIEIHEAAALTREILSMMEPKPVADMAPDEVRQYADALNGFVHQMKEVRKEIAKYGRTKTQSQIGSARSNLFAHNLTKTPTMQGKIMEAFRKWNFDVIQIPRMLAENLDFYGKGTFEDFQNRLEYSERNVAFVERVVSDIMQPHREFMTKHGYTQNKQPKKFKAIGEGGKEVDVELGIADRMLIYLGTKDPDIAGEIGRVGYKRDYGKDTLKLPGKYLDAVIDSMSAQEKAAADAHVQAYRKMGEMGNEVSMKLNGFGLFLDTFATPRLRIGTKNDMSIKDFEITLDMEKGVGFNDGFHKITFESSGRFKRRTSSDAPLLMYNPALMFSKMETLIANYYGRGEVLREANRFIMASRKGGDHSLRDEMHRYGKGTTFDSFTRYIEAVNTSAGGKPLEPVDRLFNKIMNAGIEYTAGALKYNPKVMLTQLASMPTAGAVMDEKAYRYALKYFSTGRAASIDEMSAKSPYLWRRYNGRTGVVYSDLSVTEKKARGFGGIQKMDAEVIGAVWKGIEQRISEDRPDLKGEALDKAIEAEVIDVVFKSQPSFEMVTKPELARSREWLPRMLMIFSSQRNKNLYLATKAFAEPLAKASDGTLRMDDLKQAETKLKRLAIANAIFASINTGMQQVTEQMLDLNDGKKFKFTDDDPIDTVGKLLKDFTLNYITAGMSSAGAWVGTLSTLMQGFSVDRTPGSAWVEDFGALASLHGDVSEMIQAADDFKLEEVFEENWPKYMKHLTRGGNVIAQPLTGVNIKNLYKFYIEAPLAIATKEEREEEYRRKNYREYYKLDEE
jgi:hypothetical protein